MEPSAHGSSALLSKPLECCISIRWRSRPLALFCVTGKVSWLDRGCRPLAPWARAAPRAVDLPTYLPNNKHSSFPQNIFLIFEFNFFMFYISYIFYLFYIFGILCIFYMAWYSDFSFV